MKINASFEYPDASPGQVFAMLTDTGFQERKCAATHALSYSVEITGDAGSPVVTSRRRMPTSGLPDFVRALVRDGIEIVESLSWHVVEPGGARTADVSLTFSGQPIRMSARLDVRADGCDTSGRLEGDLRAGIPLLGGRVEKATAPLIIKAVAIEEAVGREWLSEA